ncbi:hypothetical protein LCGC14_1358620 [marine sediment metagenome]|uniref:Uncharacterized protein n=1 Tax=marine sediment metagenome TaxID=412755 RepID=A0A0F9K8P2_9ZZZZ
MSKYVSLNLETGAKVIGKTNAWENILSLPVARSILERMGQIETPQADWYKDTVAALIADISKWVGDVHWDILVEKTDGVIIRMGYSATYDQRWDDRYRNLSNVDKRGGYWKGGYWYYSTGVRWQTTVKLIADKLDAIPENFFQFFAIDVEKGYNQEGGTFRVHPYLIIDELSRLFPHIQFGFYFNADTWKTWLRQPASWLEYPIWYAWYPWYPNTTQYPNFYRSTIKMENAFLWQKSADRNNRGAEFGVSSDDIDLSWSRDSKLEFFLDWDIGDVVTPDPPLPPIPVDWPTEQLEEAYQLQMQSATIINELREQGGVDL